MASISRYRDNPQGLFGLQRLNRLLDEAFTGFPFAEPSAAITSAWFAPTDVSEDNQSLQISMELPGVRPDDVKLSLENNMLTIRGEKRQHAEEQAEKVHRYERSYGAFERTFALPNTVDPEKITATYEHGILTVTIPKSERARPREIPVSSGSGNQAAQVSSGPSVQTKGSKNRQGGTDRDAEEEGSAARTGQR
jgi:HSP20 family protein